MIPPLSGKAVNRRTLLRTTGAGAVAAAGGGLVSACSDLDDDEGHTDVIDETAPYLPNHQAYDLGIQADLPGELPDLPPGYLSYPSELVKAVPETPSNTGSFEVMVPNWQANPGNDAEHLVALREATGTDVRFNMLDGNNYAEATVPILAGDEIPDGLFLFGWMLYAHPDFHTAVENRFYDLTPILSGDIAERWPLLANIPTYAWAECVWNEKLYGVPFGYAATAANGCFYREDILNDAGISVPTSIDELLAAAREVNDPDNNRWAFGGTYYYAPQWFGTPAGYLWKEDADGNLVHAFEMPEYVEMLEFRRTLHDEGLNHPDVASDTFSGKDAQKVGEVVFDQDGLTRWGELMSEMRESDPAFSIKPLPPLGPGRDPLIARNDAVQGWMFFNKNTSEEGIRALLDVSNFAAAPFGSEEWQLLSYGVEGTHFEYNADGQPEFTDLGNAEVSDVLNFQMMAGAPPMFAGNPEQVQLEYDYAKTTRPFLQDNIFQGVRVEQPADYAAARQQIEGQREDIAFGRAEISDWEGYVEEFRRNGADAARDVYAQALADLRAASGE